MTGSQADDAEALLRIAVATAGEAGRLLASWRGDERPEVVDTKSSPTDVVTEMDRRSETLIISRIRAHRPGDAVLGEEGGQTAGGPVGDESDGGRPGRLAAPRRGQGGTALHLGRASRPGPGGDRFRVRFGTPPSTG